MPLSSETRAALEAALNEDPGAVIETLAETHGVSPAEVIDCLPDGQVVSVDGARFEALMGELATWGELTLIVHTPDLVLEARGVLPPGAMGRGFYNLHGTPIGGHFRADRCAHIHLVSRKLFDKDTHSIQFYNRDGSCMFKVYLGRDAARQMIPEQVTRFLALRQRIEDGLPIHSEERS